MKDLYLLRHGETLFNLRKLNQGFSDSPLTERGIKQAKKAKKFLRENDYKFDHFYSSTQERAEDTLRILTNREYIRDKRLKERNCGIYEGVHQDITPHIFLPEEDRDAFWISVGGETERQISSRLMDFMKEIMEKEDHLSVLCVSHGTIIKNMLKYNNLIDYDIEIGNCSMIHLNYDDGKFIFVEEIDTQK